MIALVLAATVAAGAPEDARDLYAGTWQGTGTFYATPYSKAGSSSDTTICKWEAARVYLVCAQNNVSPYGKGAQLTVYARNGAKYVFNRIDAQGVTHAADVVVSGATWTYPFAFDKDGRHVLMQTINDFSAPEANRWRTEYSVDGGKTWIRIAEGIETRVGP